MISDATNHTPAAHVVAGNDDLLTEILLRLPIRPLIRFKSVSTHWLSLISNTSFSLLRNSRVPKPPISGLLLERSSHLLNPEFDFVPLNNNNDDDPEAKPPFRSLNFVNDPHGIRILQSCNGLLCCCSNASQPDYSNFYIYNPTTNKFTTLPHRNRRVFKSSHGVESVCIAFDPAKSPHYKAVCFYESESETLHDHYEIEIYSSETGLWTPSGDPFVSSDHFRSPVYWNGSIHWMSLWGKSQYFNLNTECIGEMPMPPMPEGSLEKMRPMFLGESRDHLHLIVMYVLQTLHLNLFEMEIDYSKWIVKYHVDLDSIPNAFPEMISSYLDRSNLYYYGFDVMDMVRGEKNEDPFLVLDIPATLSLLPHTVTQEVTLQLTLLKSSKYSRVSPKMRNCLNIRNCCIPIVTASKLELR